MNLEHLKYIASKNNLLEYDEYFADPVRKTVESLVKTIEFLQERIQHLENKFPVETTDYKEIFSLEGTYHTEQESGVDYNNE